MNVFLRNSIKILLVWLCAVPLVGWSQVDAENVYLTTHINQSVSHQIASASPSLAVLLQPIRGVVLGPTQVSEIIHMNLPIHPRTVL